MAWTNAAEKLSALSLTNRNLVGLVLNDFDSYVESVDYPACMFGDRLTYDQVKQIADAAHRRNPKFGFWPTCYYSFAPILSDGFVLGANYGVALINDEEMSVTFEFSTAVLPPSAQFSFLHSDSITQDDRGEHLAKQVSVNGTLVYEAAMTGQQNHELFTTNIAHLLLSAPDNNQITLTLRATGAESSCSTKFWYVWDPRVEIPTGGGMVSLPFLSTNFATVAKNTNYTSDAGCETGISGTNTISNEDLRSPVGCAALPDDPVLGYMAKRLVAAPTGRYSIRDLVDGIVAPYYPTRPPAYDAVKFGRMLDAAKANLGRAKLMPLQLGQVQSTNLDFDLAGLTEQVHLAAAKADYVGLWEMPLGLYGLDSVDPTLSRGIFAPRTSDDPSYNFLAYWPPQKAMQGWYQRWRSTSTLLGTNIQVTIHDNETSTNGFRAKLYWDKGTAGSETIWVADVADNTTTNLPSFGVTNTVVMSAELGLAWTWAGSIYFNVTNSVDLGPDSGFWTYETGVSTNMHRTYNAEKRVFLELRK